MCRAVMYGGMEETYGIRVLYSGLESRRYMGLSSCQFLLFSPTVSAYEDLRARPLRKDDEQSSRSFSLERYREE